MDGQHRLVFGVVVHFRHACEHGITHCLAGVYLFPYVVAGVIVVDTGHKGGGEVDGGGSVKMCRWAQCALVDKIGERRVVPFDGRLALCCRGSHPAVLSGRRAAA